MLAECCCTHAACLFVFSVTDFTMSSFSVDVCIVLFFLFRVFLLSLNATKNPVFYLVSFIGDMLLYTHVSIFFNLIAASK